MSPQLRRPLALVAVLAFAAVAGGLASLGHTPLAVALIAAAAGFAALMSFGARERDVRSTRRVDELTKLTRRLQSGVKRTNEKAAERDQRLLERDRRVTNRVDELERRLLAGYEAERQRAAERHRELMGLLSDERTRR